MRRLLAVAAFVFWLSLGLAMVGCFGVWIIGVSRAGW
jgi:hypothetical protein